MDSDQKLRIAQNEHAYRQANESVSAAMDKVGGSLDQVLRIACECALQGCRAVLEVPNSVFKSVREHPRRFLVAPNHIVPQVERPVDERDGFWVIDKFGTSGEEAERLAHAR